METNDVIPHGILDIWDEICFTPYSADSQKTLCELKARDYTGYCILLGLIHDVAVYQNQELPEDARGPDPLAFVVTVLAPAPAPAPRIEETRDFGEAWRLAVKELHLEESYAKMVEAHQNYAAAAEAQACLLDTWP